MKECPRCHHANGDDADSCGGCGRFLWSRSERRAGDRRNASPEMAAPVPEAVPTPEPDDDAQPQPQPQVQVQQAVTPSASAHPGSGMRVRIRPDNRPNRLGAVPLAPATDDRTPGAGRTDPRDGGAGRDGGARRDVLRPVRPDELPVLPGPGESAGGQSAATPARATPLSGSASSSGSAPARDSLICACGVRNPPDRRFCRCGLTLPGARPAAQPDPDPDHTTERVASWRLLASGFGERRDFERRIRTANGAVRVLYSRGLSARVLVVRLAVVAVTTGLVLGFVWPWGTSSRGWVGDQVGRVVRSVQNSETGTSQPTRSG